MANGYDTHSLAATGLNEAVSSSDAVPMVAVRDKRFTRTGIGFRSQTQEAASASMQDYPGGVANRRRGQVDESKPPWETAQEATSPQIRPRDTLPPSGMREALPPWLKGEDEEKEALPPWLRGKQDGDKEGRDEEERESARPEMEEAPLDAKRRNNLDSGDFALPGRKYPIDTPERARSALARVKQFGSPEDQRKVRAAVQKKYPNMKVD